MKQIHALSVATFGLLVCPALTFAQTIPPCALTGSPTVMIGGKPALRLSDVQQCPQSLVEVIPGISIDGQPMVTVKTGADAKAACAAGGNVSVLVSGKMAQGAGDVACLGAAGMQP